MIYENIEYTNVKDISNTFNQFYKNIAIKLSANKEKSKNSVEHYLKLQPKPNNKFNLRKIETKDIEKITNNMSNKHSTGPHNISNHIIKQIMPTIKNSLTTCINHSIESGTYPSILKVSKITPIYKKNIKTDPGNWRPINQLSPFSKIYEKIFCDQLESFLQNEKVIDKMQFGFKSKHSTSHSVLTTIHYLEEARNKKQHSILISLDLSKAFDTVDINSLISKFHYYCQNNTAKSWISDFFLNRRQFTKWNNYVSNTELCYDKSIVQGSSIGPKMFNLFINDITTASKFSTVLFADDTNCILSDTDPKKLEENVNKELAKIKDFFDANDLSINVLKTSFIHIKTNKSDNIKFNIKLGNENINQEKHIEFLGVIIDENLNFEAHYNKVLKKAEKGLNALTTTKNFLNYAAKINIYHSLIHSNLSYCSLSWIPKIKSTQLKKLVTLQKKALRAIFKVKYNTHTSYLFHLSQITKIDKVVEKESILLMHKYHKKELPEAVAEIIDNIRVIGCNTRSQADKIIHTQKKSLQ